MNTDKYLRNAQLLTHLERICLELELSDTQYKKAKTSYEAVGACLQDSNDPLISRADIYPQGSIKIGTTVKPLGKDEFDVDLVCFVPGASNTLSPAELKKKVGDTLKASGVYGKPGMLEEKPRCWRLNYAGDFHLDITPSISNPTCFNGGELVPDKKLAEWKASNPKGFAAWFERHAALRPVYVMNETEMVALKKSIQEFPGQETFKSILKRCVQLFKRHRDVNFTRPRMNADHAPISVILTTLAAKSYEYCIGQGAYESEFDLVLAVLRHLPAFIEVRNVNGKRCYFVMNETTKGENFAEKWNLGGGELAGGFFDWHAAALSDMSKFLDVSGLDQLGESFSGAFGKNVTDRAMNRGIEYANEARRNKALKATAAAGLVAGESKGSNIKENTFYGK